MREWWRSLERAPEPLTAWQWAAVIAATMVAAISRRIALARTPWDWDELLFMQALDHFDVAKHRPHPPGFPLYILAAKIIRKFGFGDFQALQVLSFLGAILIVPAMFFLCRELRMRTSTSLAAALLLAFFPNVWFYGGAAFSDVPSMTLVIIAVALLLAGCRNPQAYAGGAAMLAVAAGFRSQNLIVGFAPFLAASAFQIRKSMGRVVTSIAIITIVLAASYGAAAWLTGWEQYRRALEIHRQYITHVDSFLAPTRAPLWRVFDDFFVMPYQAPVINSVIGVLALTSLIVSFVRRRPHILMALAAFGPLCLITWLILDRFSAGRFSIGYAPLVAMLAADGLQWITRRAAMESVAAAIVVVMTIVWTWPALAEVRQSVAPPIAAVDWIRNHADSRRSIIYVDNNMIPFAEWYLPDYQLRFLRESEIPPPAVWAARQPGYYLHENASSSPRAENFMRPRGRLWDLARRRYFEVSVRPIADLVAFDAGWYEEEGAGPAAWRWMAARSRALLPPIEGDARLTLSLYIPLDALPAPPNVTLRINSVVVDNFRPASNTVERAVVVHARGDALNEMVIETDRVVAPAAQHLGSDTRTLGLRLNSLAWMPAAK